jgi:hypothetical protein
LLAQLSPRARRTWASAFPSFGEIIYAGTNGSTLNRLSNCDSFVSP